MRPWCTFASGSWAGRGAGQLRGIRVRGTREGAVGCWDGGAGCGWCCWSGKRSACGWFSCVFWVSGGWNGVEGVTRCWKSSRFGEKHCAWESSACNCAWTPHWEDRSKWSTAIYAAPAQSSWKSARSRSRESSIFSSHPLVITSLSTPLLLTTLSDKTLACRIFCGFITRDDGWWIRWLLTGGWGWGQGMRFQRVLSFRRVRRWGCPCSTSWPCGR